MSWDKYNEARKKAREAQNKLNKASKTVDKLTGKSDDKLTKSEINQVKTAAKNAKSYKWLFAIWAIITIAVLCTLPFSDFFESKLNTTISRAGIITSSLDARENSTLNINYINVLQGDCILINLPDGKNMIIDAGSSFNYDNKYDESSPDNVISCIKNYLVGSSNPKIDYMIMTHADFDHFSFMVEILEEFEVIKMYRPNVFYGVEDNETNVDKIAFASLEEERAKQVGSAYVTKEMYQEDKETYSGYNVKAESSSAYYSTLEAMYAEAEINGGDSEVLFTFQADEITNKNDANVSQDEIYTLKFYAPISNKSLYTDWNNYSSFMILEFNGFRYCFTGDTEEELEKQIIENYGDVLPDVDIMDAGHHGSSTSTSSALLEILNPEVVICSCDDGTEYGHPAPDTISRIIASGVPQDNIFTTHLNGNICVALNYLIPELEEETSSEEGKIVNPGNEEGYTEAETQLTPGEIEGTTYMVGISKDGEISITEIKWWYIVVGIIVISGVILLVIVPSVIKTFRKKK